MNRQVNTSLTSSARHHIFTVFHYFKWPLFVIFLSYILVSTAEISFVDIHINHQLLLEYIATLRWPLIVLFALWLMRDKLGGIIDRIEDLSILGNRAKFRPSPQEDPAPDSVIPKSTPALEKFEEHNERPETLSEDKSQEADDLKTRVGVLEIQLEFEKIYRVIYGTQLQALKKLNIHKEGLHPNDLQNFFYSHTKLMMAPYAHNDLQAFMRILIVYKLADYDAIPNQYKITTKGEVFLNYLKHENVLNMQKSY